MVQAGENKYYNNMCPAGFISVRSDVPLGLVLDPSIRGTMISYNIYSLLKGCQLLKVDILIIYIITQQSMLKRYASQIVISQIEQQNIYKK